MTATVPNHAAHMDERPVSSVARGAGRPAEIFGEFALSWQAIAHQLDDAAADALRAFVRTGTPPKKDDANRIAGAVLQWGIKRGVTHYAHWFQPLTGLAAEKHDAFISIGIGEDGATQAIEEFKGAVLWQGEPDASSFPSGGLRVTHEARGYTLWDPKTPIFLRDDGGVRTLCIPCAYIGYGGQALDHKTPLLRATAALSRNASRFLELIAGEAQTQAVTATLGTEQEYFLVDRRDFQARPDLVMAGRTLLGNVPERNQQLEDHYFGVIPGRVIQFMAELEADLYRVGIPVKTRHCEVAPSQFELAPIFEEVAVACDHNILTMEVMRRVAQKHGLVCLLHEKPFAGVNGSGKHNNWSMSTDAGENLLDLGDTPAEHLRFAAVLAAILQGVHRHAALLRVTVASAGNDHRLGANEAPPPIISAFLGESIDAIANAVERGEALAKPEGKTLAVAERLIAKLDTTDRNRTAPFAFTGNKFEYRAVGSGENCAWPMTVLCAAVADALGDLGDDLAARLNAGEAREAAVLAVIRKSLAASRDVRFEGNNYGAEWQAEAARRGLPILANTPAALAVLLDPSATGFLLQQGVFTAAELSSRYEIYAERYIKLLEIEGQTLSNIAATQILPVLEQQIAASAGAMRAYAEVGAPSQRHQRVRVQSLIDLSEALQASTADLNAALGGIHGHLDTAGALNAVGTDVVSAMAAVRAVCDRAEAIVAEALWPFPTYRKILFRS